MIFPVTMFEHHQNQSKFVKPGDAPTSIFLVGMMGAGKTTLGRHLARLLNRKFIDLDQELEARCGVSVAVIFDIEGEQGFRVRESEALDACTRQSGIVLATGGGAVLSAQNRVLLKKRGTVIYLRASAQELYRRLAYDKSRPLLQTKNPKARIAQLVQEREPLYEEVADYVFETGFASVKKVVHDLMTMLETKGVINSSR